MRDVSTTDRSRRPHARTFVLATLAVVGCFAAHPVIANRPVDKRDAGVGAISGGSGVLAATGIGLPLAAFGGGFQLGWGIGRLIWDPVDTANACVPVDFDAILAGNHFPDANKVEPGLDATLAARLDTHFDDLDQLVALARSVRASVDRYSGALALSNTSCANARRSEAEAFLVQLKARAVKARASLEPVLTRADELDPATLDTLVGQQPVREVRDQIAAGSYPSFESIAINAWHFSTTESAFFQRKMSAMPDSAIDELFTGSAQLTLRDVWRRSTDAIVEGIQEETIASILDESDSPD